jgi:hypothetical protein
MQPVRFLAILSLAVVLAGFALTRGVGRELAPVVEAARHLGTALQTGPLAGADCEPAQAITTEYPRPGVAAFVEVEGSLFRILVGRDGEGETWSAAVSGVE